MYLGISKGCRFGGCCNYSECNKKVEDYTQCEDFRECFAYMDKYGNDIELWEDLHGE